MAALRLPCFPSLTNLSHIPNSTRESQFFFISKKLYLSRLLCSSSSKPSNHFAFRLSSSALTQALMSPPDSEEEYSKSRLLASNVPWNCTPEDVRFLFEKYGRVLDVELSMYNKTRNRGLAFVTMGSPEEALTALNNLESYEFEGRTLKINYAKAKPKIKKRTLPEKPKEVPVFNLFIANLSYEARAKHLKEFFDSGSNKILSAQVIFQDTPRKSSGYGFVSFKSKKAAEAALTEFDGKIFMGRPIRVARSKQFVKLQDKEGLSEDASELISDKEHIVSADESERNFSSISG